MNLDKVRNDTPYCKDKLFLNSAGASLMPNVVLNKVKNYLDEATKIGGYAMEDQRHGEIRSFYQETAKMLNCHEHNIAFANSATHAYFQALYALDFNSGDVILTTNDDYVSNQIAFLSLQKRVGVKIIRAANLPNGDLDLDQFESLMKHNQPKVVAVTHVPTNSGLIQDVESIGKMCKDQDVMYLVDACQSVGQIPVDVQSIGCDFLSATGRKFLRGPRGTGFLFVSDKALALGLTPMLLDTQAAIWSAADEFQPNKTAQRYEYTEVPFALLIGLKEAIRYANDIGIDIIENYNNQIQQRLREKLSEVAGVTLYDRGSKQANIITLQKEGSTKEDFVSKLNDAHVYYSLGLPHHAIIDYQRKGIDWVIRFSPHYFNTLEEMDQVAKIIDDI